MLEIRDKGLILYILEHCKRINEKVKSINKLDFNNDRDIQEIVCFNILQIGELVKRLSEDFIKANNQIPWKKIKGMRDVVVHGYGKIELDDVWKTSTVDVPKLQEYCLLIL